MKDTPMGRADLHCHTYYSDGELSPRAVVEEARRIGLRALAITDHDTMEGLQELTPVPGLEIVPGIERKAFGRASKSTCWASTAIGRSCAKIPGCSGTGTTATGP